MPHARVWVGAHCPSPPSFSLHPGPPLGGWSARRCRHTVLEKKGSSSTSRCESVDFVHPRVLEWYRCAALPADLGLWGGVCAWAWALGALLSVKLTGRGVCVGGGARSVRQPSLAGASSSRALAALLGSTAQAKKKTRMDARRSFIQMHGTRTLACPSSLFCHQARPARARRRWPSPSVSHSRPTSLASPQRRPRLLQQDKHRRIPGA